MSSRKSKQTTTTEPSHARSNKPLYANFAAENLTLGAGVAIFHLASERVVVCYHSRDKYWFLPKGRKNVGESLEETACREGFEESGYRCRLLPLPFRHRQPPSDLDDSENPDPYCTQSIWTQLLPQSSTTQYMLFWYAAETVSEDIEEALRGTSQSGRVTARAYAAAPPFPADLTLADRVKQDMARGAPHVYEPFHHEGTGVDEEEACYQAHLLPVSEAREKLKGSIMEDVVRRAWEAIATRQRMEADNDRPAV